MAKNSLSNRSVKRVPDLICRAVLALALLLGLAPWARAQEDKISRPGQYSGYSQPKYDEWVRTSQYVAVRDGAMLAVDIFRPATNGELVNEPLPVIWSHNRYHRADDTNGQLRTILDSAPWLKTLLAHGYVVGVADVRGSGASYGKRTELYSMQDALDAFDLTEWFAAQPWCDGNVGMFGASFMGAVQLMTASLAPPHLKAIVPQVAPFDRYAEYYPGGVFADQAAATWSQTVKQFDTLTPAAPVDEDRDGAMLAEAMRQHRTNADFYQLVASLPYRDSAIPAPDGKTSLAPWLTGGAVNHLPAISQSGVAIYHMAGWYDYYRRGALLAFNNLRNPQKVLVGPWTHNRYGEYFDLGAEHLRWYDYWLKGIDNGIMDEPPIYYSITGLPEKQAWRFAQAWPLPEEQSTNLYFHAGPSKSARSVNDGLLYTYPPAGSAGQDDYTVDYSATTTEGTEWNDQKGLTYTSPPLPQSVQVSGHPVVHLWIASTAQDGDFFVALEEVTPGGTSVHLTDGVLRASHRALAQAPFDALGLPYHRSFAQDMAGLPTGEPVELVFDLLPISNLFDAGHRIRVTLTGIDKGNTQTPLVSPPPTISVYRDASHASYVTLPIIPARAGEMVQLAGKPDSTGIILASVVGGIAILLAIAGLALRGRKQKKASDGLPLAGP